MKVKNCRLVRSIQVAGKEFTYLQADSVESRSQISLEIVSFKNHPFLKVVYKNEVKIVPMVNIGDMGVEIDSTEDGKGSDKDSLRGASAQKAGGVSQSVAV